MKRDIILGFARHLLTAAGGFLVAKGNFDAADLDTIVGAAVTLAGAVWSALDKRGRKT
jgi:hypothetical protein